MTRNQDQTALQGGYWERTGLIMVWKPTPAPVFDVEPATKPLKGWEEITLELQARHSTDNALRVAHAAYNRGERDPLTVARNREWERRYRAKRREQGRG